MNFSSKTTPSGKSSIIVEITYRNQSIDIKKTKEKVIQDLIKTNIISEEDEIDICEAKDFKYAYVIYDLDHRKNIKVIHDYIIAHNIIPIGRFGEWEYFNMDKTILSGKNAAEKIK
jgi:protoporphyrinogen oxidase